MRRGDHQPARITQPLREQGDRRSRNDTSVLNRRGRETETLLKLIENPRARDARVLSDQNFSSQPLSDRPADRNDRRRIQWKFACASSNTVRAKQLRTHVIELIRGHSFFPLWEIAVEKFRDCQGYWSLITNQFSIFIRCFESGETNAFGGLRRGR